MEGPTQNEKVFNPEEEIGELRNKITETFKEKGLAPDLYEAIKEWRDKKYESVREETRPEAILDYHIGLAEIYGEIGDTERLEECINDLYGNDVETWESFIKQVGEESEAHISFRDRLNKLLEILDGSTETL